MVELFPYLCGYFPTRPYRNLGIFSCEIRRHNYPGTSEMRHVSFWALKGSLLVKDKVKDPWPRGIIGIDRFFLIKMQKGLGTLELSTWTDRLFIHWHRGSENSSMNQVEKNPYFGGCKQPKKKREWHHHHLQSRRCFWAHQAGKWASCSYSNISHVSQPTYFKKKTI